MESNLDKRYQTLVVLWFALLMSIGMYFLFSMFVAPKVGNEPRNPASSLLIVALTALGTFLVISFPVNEIARALVERQDVGLVHRPRIVAPRGSAPWES
jgi:hypothetical protein